MRGLGFRGQGFDFIHTKEGFWSREQDRLAVLGVGGLEAEQLGQLLAVLRVLSTAIKLSTCGFDHQIMEGERRGGGDAQAH